MTRDELLEAVARRHREFVEYGPELDPVPVPADGRTSYPEGMEVLRAVPEDLDGFDYSLSRILARFRS